MLRSEVLPAPFGPMTETSPPRRTERVRLSTARTPPKCFDTPEMASWVSPDAPAATLKLPNTRPSAFPHPPALSTHAAPLWQVYCWGMRENAIASVASEQPLRCYHTLLTAELVAAPAT